jgi:type IV pilus assembly protein PilB
LPRLLDLGIEPYLITSTVNIAIGQRLVRKICEHCKTPKALTSVESKSLKEALPITTTKKAVFYHGEGCSECNFTGYRGRIGIYEVLVIDSKIRDAILAKAKASEIKKLAQASGMKTMVEDGIEKAKAGHTTLEEVLRMLHE